MGFSFCLLCPLCTVLPENVKVLVLLLFVRTLIICVVFHSHMIRRSSGKWNVSRGTLLTPPESAQLKQVKEVKAKTTWKCYYKPKADATNDVVIEEDFTKKSWTWPSICTGGPVVTLEPDSSNNDDNNNNNNNNDNNNNVG